jgi:hypothetical protein
MIIELSDSATQQEVHSGLIAYRRRQHLIFAGYSEAEILQLGDLAKLTNGRVSELMTANKLEGNDKAGEEINKKIPHVTEFPDDLAHKHVVLH